MTAKATASRVPDSGLRILAALCVLAILVLVILVLVILVLVILVLVIFILGVTAGVGVPGPLHKVVLQHVMQFPPNCPLHWSDSMQFDLGKQFL